MRVIVFIVIILFAYSSSAQITPDKRKGDSHNKLRFEIPATGSRLPDSLMVYRPNGDFVKLSSLFYNKYTVIVTGCLTCPIFGKSYPGVDAMHLDYFKTVQFYYLYKTLIHPELNGYIQPVTIAERMMHITEAEKKLHTKVPCIIDPMTNEVSAAFGLGSNSVFMFDKSGQIVYRNYYTDIGELRSKLVELAGPLNRPPTGISIQSAIYEEVFSPVEFVSIRNSINERFVPIISQPLKLDSIHYVKLRTEVTKKVFNSGSGFLYLGFHLDPIHHVHWNNLVDPLKYSISLANGVIIEDSLGIAPRDSSVSDRKPREFLVKVNNWALSDTLPIKVVYYACDELNKWCRIMIQEYQLILKKDPFAGFIKIESNIELKHKFLRLWSNDSNNDGKLSMDEFPERIISRFIMMDVDHDGFITEKEYFDRMSKPGRKNGSNKERLDK